MGRRGPAPKTIKQLKLSGSPRARKAKREPKVPKGMPACPEYLSANAKKVWRALVPMLAKLGVVSKLDGNALTRYCDLFVQWRVAQEYLDKNGLTYELKDEDGDIYYTQQYPQVSIVRSCATALLRLEQEFGMTPSARASLANSGVRMGGKGQDDEEAGSDRESYLFGDTG